ncbi:MAG: copper homeostasis protein CutC [Pygmaiobacter sp.]
MEQPYLLECCVDSVESALAAVEGGATRLELCSSLVTGGLTPSLALFREIRRRCAVRIHVLLRPRFGDFLYTEAELDVLREEVRLFKQAGAEGIVIGCLAADGALDVPKMRSLIDLAGGMSITLHRAFDLCIDPFAALEAAKALGIKTILTSGGQNTCVLGKPMLKKLLSRAGDVTILVGSGVNAEVIADFLRDTPAHAFHMSGKVVIPSGMQYHNETVSMGVAALDEYAIWRTDAAQIRAAAQLLRL